MYKYISIISLFFILLALGEAQLVINPGQQKKEIIISQGSQKCKGDSLYQDQYLLPGQQLFSNGYSAVLQRDGNFVLYANYKAIWASDTFKKGGVKLIMRKDGNLVIYNMQDKPVWASNTVGKGIPPYRLTMQSDKNLKIYDGKNQSIWAADF